MDMIKFCLTLELKILGAESWTLVMPDSGQMGAGAANPGDWSTALLWADSGELRKQVSLNSASEGKN